MAISRYFNEINLDRIKKDFAFLFEFIKKSYGEYDFAIRDNYFNIYYKGNSLTKVIPKKDGYEVSIHPKFLGGTGADSKFDIEKKEPYFLIKLTKNQLHSFFQVKHMNQFASNIKKVNNGEEITFEQMIITDNLDRKEFIFIDRQVTDTDLKRKRLDLLALEKVENNKNDYKFVVCEVKMGNNPELSEFDTSGNIKVLAQTEHYIRHIEEKFDDYKKCYEKHFTQKVTLGLIMEVKKINIIKPVKGLIIVGGYSKKAKKQVEALEGYLKNPSFSHIKYKSFKYEI